jgi:prolyl 4-hydroxylase
VYITCCRHCDGDREKCHSLEPVHLELEVLSQKPRAFLIKDFFSDFEAEHIKSFGKPRLSKSIVGDVDSGAYESDTRTSRNTWLPRKTTAITETLFRRVADLLQIDERKLHRHEAAEDMQIVHYTNGQKYDSHHDWGVNGVPESRFITLLLYLNDMESPTAGGETAFTKGGEDGLGFKIHAGKGNAVLFYDLLEDGNGDDLSLHAALPVVEGEKWLANFWVWDPSFKE